MMLIRNFCNYVIEKGYTLLHPFDDENVIAGRGLSVLKSLEEMPDVRGN